MTNGKERFRVLKDLFASESCFGMLKYVGICWNIILRNTSVGNIVAQYFHLTDAFASIAYVWICPCFSLLTAFKVVLYKEHRKRKKKIFTNFLGSNRNIYKVWSEI